MTKLLWLSLCFILLACGNDSNEGVANKPGSTFTEEAREQNCLEQTNFELQEYYELVNIVIETNRSELETHAFSDRDLELAFLVLGYMKVENFDLTNRFYDSPYLLDSLVKLKISLLQGHSLGLDRTNNCNGGD